MSGSTIRVQRFATLVEHLRRVPRMALTVLVGIDGHGGSGKSTFAGGLSAASPDVQVLHMDDFGHVTGYPKHDWPRLQSQVLEPIRRDQPGCYQRHDWTTDELAEWHVVPTGGIVVVEGVGALRREIRDAYAFQIWVETPRPVCLTRGLARDGERMRAQWEHWLATEDTYVHDHQPMARVDLGVDGSGSVPHVVGTEYVRSGNVPLFR